MNITEVILVDENDQPQGVMEKLEAHQKGVLHRAFSVFILNKANQMLLQRRALSKYHSPGLWTNACCSHPAPGEMTVDAAQRRLTEEMGFTCSLTKIKSFVYRTEFDNGLIEHEFDHIFLGDYNGSISPDKNEVEEYRWYEISEIDQLLKNEPTQFTSWFKIAYPLLKNWLAEKDSSTS